MIFENLTDSRLIELASQTTFIRGKAYFQDGHVVRLKRGEAEVRAVVEGSEDYQVRLYQRGDTLHWQCSCPAAEDGSFCKHLVAVALAAREEGDQTSPAAAANDELLTALKNQSAETLADWLYEIACDEPVLEQQLRSRLSLLSPVALKELLKDSLRTGGFLDYRRSMDYAQKLEAPLDLLARLLDNSPKECAELSEYVIKRLLKIYETADDSAGAIGDQTRRFAELHAEAVKRGGMEGRKLAMSFYKLKLLDDWDLFPLADYWDAMGSAGQKYYGDQVEKEYAALSPPAPDNGLYRSFIPGEYSVLHRMEEVCFQRGDMECLAQIYSRDLSFPAAYEKMVAMYRHFGRDAEATAWAEKGVREHPRSSDLHILLAEEYQRAGLTEEALESMWSAFQRVASEPVWDSLKQLAGRDWPRWREQALALLASRESRDTDGRLIVTERVRLLVHDGDLSEAVTLARDGGLDPYSLERLAAQCSHAFPSDAAAFFRRCVDYRVQEAQSKQYPSLVKLMKRARDVDPGDETRQWLQAIRARYARRPALIERMDKVKL
jgi:uncharacterized Zn finger protein